MLRNRCRWNEWINQRRQTIWKFSNQRAISLPWLYSSPFMFTCSNMGWVFAAHLQEGLSPISTLWCPALFYFTFLRHCQNEYPLMGFLVFITCNTRWIWIVSLTTNLHLDSASKMPSHYSFHLPSAHFAIFHTVLKTTPLILKIMDWCGTTEQVSS